MKRNQDMATPSSAFSILHALSNSHHPQTNITQNKHYALWLASVPNRCHL